MIISWLPPPHGITLGWKCCKKDIWKQADNDSNFRLLIMMHPLMYHFGASLFPRKLPPRSFYFGLRIKKLKCKTFYSMKQKQNPSELETWIVRVKYEKTRVNNRLDNIWYNIWSDEMTNFEKYEFQVISALSRCAVENEYWTSTIWVRCMLMKLWDTYFYSSQTVSFVIWM